MNWNNSFEHAVGHVVEHVIGYWKNILNGLIWTGIALWTDASRIGFRKKGSFNAVVRRYWIIRFVFRSIMEITRIKLNVKKIISDEVLHSRESFYVEWPFNEPTEWTFSTTQKRSASASEFLKSIKRLAMLLEVVILSTHRKMKNLLFKIFLLRFSFGKSFFHL